MSEAKSEVEYVIKTGRQVVEKKQVDSPELLNSQIDSVKLLYNELGAQVFHQCLETLAFSFNEHCYYYFVNTLGTVSR